MEKGRGHKEEMKGKDSSDPLGALRGQPARPLPLLPNHYCPPIITHPDWQISNTNLAQSRSIDWTGKKILKGIF